MSFGNHSLRSHLRVGLIDNIEHVIYGGVRN